MAITVTQRKRTGRDGSHPEVSPSISPIMRSTEVAVSNSCSQLGDLCHPDLHGLSCGASKCPRVTVRDRSSSGLMAR
jgi:hypothetical protein